MDAATAEAGEAPIRERAAALRSLLGPSADAQAPQGGPGKGVPGADDALQASVDLLSCAAAAIPYWVPRPCGGSGEYVQVTMKFGGSTADPRACVTNADLRSELLKRGWTLPPAASPPAVSVSDGVTRITRDSGLMLEDVLQSSPFVFARIRPSANFPPRCQFEFSLIAL
ncbi:MAG TPA: hypothetical protein VFQ67_01435 [Allosphingosinicella sp.]|jgi:hypothetical protein|nr:hypothetical protein [Allosphingosinicella sp.]